jgi:hypothetical protein
VQEQNSQLKSQPDKNLAREERPVPSQAEGDRETIEQDLKQRENKEAGEQRKGPRSSGAGRE